MSLIQKFQAILYTLSLWMLASVIYASTLSVHTEPASISPGEPFNLILELDENAPAGLPNFGALNYDFHVHGTSHRASYVYVNGQSKASTRWSVTLVPKHTGKITIPAIQVGQARSEPITLNIGSTTVSQTSASVPKPPDQALFIKTALSKQKPFLNQQILYTVKIFHFSSILDAAYQPPSLGDALMVPLGNNKQSQVIENGRPYLVEEQKYAFFPQKTGTQILFPPKFQALIYDDIPRRAEAQGNSVTLDIQNIPKPFTQSTWLPAKALSLRENYDQKNTHLTEGSTLTRTITIKSTGLPAELLPPFSHTKSKAFKSYPEHPVRNNTVVGDDVIGSATIKITYLLNKAGSITIPAQKIMWFNTETQLQSTATLPAKTLQIIPDPNSRPETPTISRSAPLTTIKKPSAPKPSIIHGLIFHAALLSVLICLGLIILIATRKKSRASQHKTSKQPSLKALKKACLSNQPQTARDALLAWAKEKWPDINILNLDDVMAHAENSALTKTLHTLSKALYCGKKTAAWQGRELWLAVLATSKKHKMQSNKKPESDPLPPINPEN